MKPRELHRIGETLYGEGWKEALAKRLKVNVRTIRRWLSGETPIDERDALAIRSLKPGGRL